MSELAYILSRLATDATGLWQAIRSEVDSLVKERVESFLLASACVRREEFEASRGLLERALRENEQLRERLSVLEENFKNVEVEKKV